MAGYGSRTEAMRECGIGLPPQLLKARVAAAAPAVIGVFGRVLEVVVLVVVLGDPEVRGRLDRDHDRLLEAAGGGKRRLRGLGQAALLLVMDEDRRPVGLALVAELAFGIEWVDVLPVDLEELVVADLRRVVDDPHRLGVAGAAHADLAVGGAGDLAAGVARGRRDDALGLVVGRLDAPEAARREGRDGKAGTRRLGALRRLVRRGEREAERAGERREEVGEAKRSWPQPAQVKVPRRFSRSSGLEPARSVPCWRST